MLQRILSSTKSSRAAKTAKDNTAWQFSELMMTGRVKDALRLLSEDKCGGPLPIASSVMNTLLEMHPKKREPVSSTQVGDSSVPF